MATLVLSAAGAAAGSAIGGSVLGLSAAAVGRAAGAVLGRAIDARLLGQGSGAVDGPRVERFRFTGASEGAAIPIVWGRMRVAGQVIWASRFQEHVRTSGGSGKGTPKAPKTREFFYTVSLAVALAEGVIARVGRVWADGVEIAADDLNLRIYPGDEDQLPDPKIAAVEGEGSAPAFRGVAYVVIEDLDLTPFGTRVPQFSFEVIRPARGVGLEPSAAERVRAVALIPGSGEYALATTPVHFRMGPGVNRLANVNTVGPRADIEEALDQLLGEAPECRSVALVVSWFGDDLRAGTCRVLPKVEQKEADGRPMRWRVSGVDRDTAEEVSRVDGRPAFGGTPADAAVWEAVAAVKARGMGVVFYPFLMMDVPAGNGLPDPWTGAEDQPAYPWRGRITTALAPGREGSTDGTETAVAEVAAFFGQAGPGDFTVEGDGVRYTGPEEFSYRRMVLHQAHLAAVAGVEGFVIGSELRSLTQARGPGNSFPAVEELRLLAVDCRAILGSDVKIGYAADWSEYFGYQPQDGSGDVFFHLDPLWADEAVDFVGIDNYMPLADWRDGEGHADAVWGAVHNLDYLGANIEGGEGFDWFYDSGEGRAAQRRRPIEDGAYGEPWVFRFKDIRAWWENAHHDRVGGVRAAEPSPWVPQSKPVWFTELGCPAVDKGANQPNVFVDPKSAESALPHFSDGRRDDLMQLQYLRALLGYWEDPANNPVSEVYDGPMIDMGRAHVWAWDARPWPAFPNARDIWADGANHARGHWLTGRLTVQTLDAVIAEICARSGVAECDVAGLHGIVRGYAVAEVASGRALLQPLLLAHGMDAAEREGRIRFRARRDAGPEAVLEDGRFAVDGEVDGLEAVREAEAELSGRVRVGFTEAEADFEARVAEAVLPDEETLGVAQSDLPLALTPGEGRAVAERFLAEARVARDRARFALPPSTLWLGAGDLVAHVADGVETLYRIDRVEEAGIRRIEAVRVERGLYTPSDAADELPAVRAFRAFAPVEPQFLDLPLLRGDEVPHAPHIAVAARPWPGVVAVCSALADAGYEVNTLVASPATIGETESPLFAAPPGRWDRRARLKVRLGGGALASAEPLAVLSGANVAAIGDGSSDRWEVFQFAGASLVGENLWELSMLLRGQAGSDALMPDEWPEGSRFVLLDRSLEQISLPLSARGLARDYRIGPAERPHDDPVFVAVNQAFAGVGLRPLSPVHMRVAGMPGAKLDVTWIRRTRVDGDSWESVEVPLGEEREAYLVRVIADGAIRREVEVGLPGFTYTSAMQTADRVEAPFEMAVAQVSAAFGPGLFGRVLVG